MANKSTRSKIKYHSAKVDGKFQDILLHMKDIDDLADGHSDVINANLPSMVEIISNVQDMYKKFHELL